MGRWGDGEMGRWGDGEMGVSEKACGEKSKQTRRRGDAETPRIEIPPHISFTREMREINLFLLPAPFFVRIYQGHFFNVPCQMITITSLEGV